MDVSVIIVNYNTREITQNCLDSIFQYTQGIKFEVILVDNASTDGSKEHFEQDYRIKYIYSKKNLGFGKANNLGYKYATGKYLFLLNSDTLLLNNAIALFYEAAEKEVNSVIGCWGTMLIDPTNNIGISYGKFLSPWKDLYIQLLLLPFAIFTKQSVTQLSNMYNYKSETGIVDYISGADLFLKKEIADRYGLFSPQYFMYSEDADMQKRYAKNNIKAKILRSPKIIHLEGGSQKKSSYKNMIMLSSKIIFFKNWANPISLFFYRLILSFMRLILLILGDKNKKKYQRQYLKTLWI